MINRPVRPVYCGIILIVCLLLACAAFSSAEEKGDQSIFSYKKELSITDKQEKNLRDILTKFQNNLAAKQKELGVLSDELNKMITDKAGLGKIKAKLQNIARIQADATYEDIASTRAIEKELTAEQMSRWRGMQEDFRKNQQQAQAAASKAKEDAGQQKVKGAVPGQ